MAKASTQLQENPNPPEDSILPQHNETYEEWSERVDRMLQEFSRGEDKLGN